MDLVERIELKNDHVLNIYQDEDPESPREWDNLGIMICCHSRYNLGDKQVSDKHAALMDMADSLDINLILQDLEMYDEIYGDAETLEEWLNLKNDWVCLPLYLYDHSGITMSTSSFSCRWDSGQVGYIYCPTSTILKEYGNIDPETLDKVTKCLEAEVKTYDQYLTGDVYGFKLMKITKCDYGHEHEEEIDSCWGFYGSDYKTNGIFDNIDNKLINFNL